jgi:16S rRNA (uracil1498-N3)-methyltransferase
MKTKRRIYLGDAALAAGMEIRLSGAHANYLHSVLRLAAGADVYVFNKKGEFRGEIIESKKSEVLVQLLEQTRAPLIPPLSYLTLSFAPLKKDRTDFLVEKAGELGAHCLQPVFTDHTQSERVNTERLQIIAIEAAEQCDRLDAPEVLPPMKLQNYLQNLPDDTLLFLAAESGDAAPIAAAFSSLSSRKLAELSATALSEAAIRDPRTIETLDRHGIPARGPSDLGRDDNTRNIHFLIGPEGGFSDAEFESFARHPNIRRIRLGPRLLRAETAAVAVLSAFQAIAGDWNQPGVT